MSSENIKDLVEKFSCELVLVDPESSKCLSGLLPILKQLHTKCMKLSLKSEAKAIIKARQLINEGIENKDSDLKQQITFLGTFISDLSMAISSSDRTEQIPETEEDNIDESSQDTMSDYYLKLEKKLDDLTKLIYDFFSGRVADFGAILNCLDVIIEVSNDIEASVFNQISLAFKEYIVTMNMDGFNNSYDRGSQQSMKVSPRSNDLVDFYINTTTPIEECLVLLKSILRHLKKDEAFTFDYSDVLELLKVSCWENQKPENPESKEGGVFIKDQADKGQAELEKISDDDMEILIDFVSESQENLNTIEVNLIDLEQDPSNKDIINNIFRPFHTIKGVSGFLSLPKINKLAHITENLLDSARSGEFLINANVTDAVLESVDMLKELIERLGKGTDTGFIQPDDDIDVNGLGERLQSLHLALTKGDKEPLGSILVRKNIVDKDSLDQALESQKNRPEKKIGEILLESQKVKSGQIASALMEQNISKKKMDVQVKVSTQKLDDLVDYAGELVIAQSMLKQKTINNPLLSQNVAQLGQIVTNMQNIAMSMRMIPIKFTFMKMIRLIRDLAKKTGKDVNLSMVGEDTEIDRNLVDALYEPMVHMIRNAVDHGIELQAQRIDQGKPAQGEIVLRAYHKGGQIIIEIEDDGKGLDKDRILEKAKNTGVIAANAQMTEAQVYDLILQPGFSTAKEITNVSGRGVGMDVVKDAIEKFRGRLNIESKKGKGTKFTISLPLTLAIIDGMLVRVDKEKYVIPTIAIQKAFKPSEDEYFTVAGKGEMVKDRGSLIPIIRLDEIYNSGGRKKTVEDCLVVVVESKEEKRAFLIDELLGKDEYVIKSLGKTLEDVDGIAGGAILADGRVGLILDIDGIFTLVSKEQAIRDLK